jgi:hypothetical protein
MEKVQKLSNSEEKGLFSSSNFLDNRHEGTNDIRVRSYSKYISLKSLLAFSS